ncbi:hypothetical protein CGRA01v4_02290 [Colletotrichum graminicola]|nr:hypothetical protein CGRA01v4_02290 [Colletotrichum graminicola]
MISEGFNYRSTRCLSTICWPYELRVPSWASGSTTLSRHLARDPTRPHCEDCDRIKAAG